MELRIINSINSEDGKIGIYMDTLELVEEKRDYWVGNVRHFLNKDAVFSSPATFFILNDFMQVGRILKDSRRMKCNNLLAPFAVGLQEANQWVVAFRNSIDYSFIEWDDENLWIEVDQAETIVRSLVQLMECVHGRGFRIGCSLESPRCYGLMRSGAIFLIDLEGSICSLPDGNDEEEEKQKDIAYLSKFLKEKIVSKLKDQAGLTLRDFVELMNYPSIKFSDLKGHPFCLNVYDDSWFYNRMKLWLDRIPISTLDTFEMLVKKKKNALRWEHFPDWPKFISRSALLNDIYQHNKEQYEDGGAKILIRLGRNGMTHFQDYGKPNEHLTVAKAINDMYPNFMAVCYTAKHIATTTHRWS